MLSAFEEPTYEGDGWWRFGFLPYSDQQHLRSSEGDYQKAFHGLKMESVYSTAFHAKLAESDPDDWKSTTLQGAKGVYCHSAGDESTGKKDTSKKTSSYMIHVNMFNDDVFYAARWELYVDRNRKVKPPKKTDQWIQPMESVDMVALWVHAVHAGHLKRAITDLKPVDRRGPW